MAAKRRKIVAEDFDKGYGATTIPTDSGGVRAASKAGLHTWSRVINIMDTGASGDGLKDDTVAIQAAVTEAGLNRGVVYIPRGTFKISDTITVAADRVNIIGAGQQASILKFDPTTTGKAAIHLTKPTAALIVQNAVRGITIDATGNTQGTKAAIKVTDAEELIIDDVAVANFSSGAKDCVGLHLRGRQTHSISNVTINADRPVLMDGNPNSTIDVDHYHFWNCYLLAATTQPCVEIADGANVSTLVIDGYQAWVGGTYGLYWSDTTGAAAPLSVVIKNVRWEQSTNATGYILYISTLGAGSLAPLVIENCYGGSGTNHKGYYLRGVRGGAMLANQYAGTIEALNINSTVALNFIGNHLNLASGATVSSSGFVNGVWAGNENTRVGIGAAAPTADLVLANNRNFSIKNAAGTEKQVIRISAGDKIVMDDDTLGVEMEGTLFVGALAHPSSHRICIPNAQSIGGGNAAASDTLAMIGVDTTNRVVVNGSSGTGLLIHGAEITAPSAPAANTGVIFFQDNGGGKTQLVVRFATGAIQTIATEP